MATVRHGTATGSFGPNVLADVWLEKTFVSVLRERLLATKLGKESTLPDNMGKTVRWQFFSKPGTDTATLTEGGEPTNSTDFTTTTAVATLAEYGGFTEYTRFLTRTALSGTLQEIVEGLAFKASQSMDAVVLGVIDGTSTTVDSGTALTAESVRTAAATLAANDAQFHRSTGGRFYPLICTTNAAYDMLGEGAPTWFQAKSGDYVDSLTRPFDDTEKTSGLYNVIVRTSNNIQTGGGDDLNVMIADDSFGVASMTGDVMQPKVFINRPEDIRDMSAPLRNRGTAAYWLLFATQKFDDNRLVAVLADT